MTKKILSFTLTTLLILQVFFPIVYTSVSAEELESVQIPAKKGTYDAYIEQYGDISPCYSAVEVLISADDIAKQNSLSTENVLNKNAIVLNNINDKLTVKFDVTEEGFYYFGMDYAALPDNQLDIELSLELDGNIMFDGMKKITLSRVFELAVDEFEKDNRGNELRPVQTEVQLEQTAVLEDGEGSVGEPYQFWLTKGEHTVIFTLKREKLAIYSFRVFGEQELKEYSKPTDMANVDAEPIIIEAEHPKYTSSIVLNPESSMNNPNTTPSDPSLVRFNVIGGENWVYPSQKIVWEFNVKNSGYYAIGFRFLQKYQTGMNTYRRIKIDGEYPFKEFQSQPFGYDAQWQIELLGQDEPYYIWLDAGVHTIEASVTTGEISELINGVERAVYKLNEMYREIITVTGTTPDIYRDYYLDQMIPGLMDDIKLVSNALKASESAFLEKTGADGGEASTLQQIYYQLDDFYKRPSSIPSRLTTFETNISSLATWVMDIREQPLQIDKLYIIGYGSDKPTEKYGFFDKLWFSTKAFIMSFFTDYSSVGSTYEDAITVWINSGRDQAEIVKNMIDNEFTVEKGIPVNFSIVQSNLMQAVMAGKGPDVALFVSQGQPVNMALRSAVLPLNDFDDFDEVAATYQNTELLPYSIDDKCYALPEKKNFYMMFYRTDVFDELGIKAPNTWDELYDVAEVLQRNNMNIGLPYSAMSAYDAVNSGIGATSIFPTLLAQCGIGFYNDTLTATNLTSEAGFKTFKTWTEFYTLYGFPLIKSDFNRFRSGDMPLTISNYSFYNQLYAAAPEIKNLWKMVAIPATVGEDGKLNRTQISTGTACIMIRDVSNKQSAWEFMKWWTEAETQGAYGREVESLLGVAARHTPIKKEALKLIPWSGDELDTLLNQYDNVIELPEIAGGYYSSRNVDNALRAVVYNNENPRETLNYWNKKTDEEIIRKREEFGLN